MKKILCILQLPPPINGVTMMNSFLINSQTIKEKYKLDIISLRFASSMGDINKFRIEKIFLMIKIWLQILLKIILNKYAAAYFTANLTGFAFYRDIFYIVLLKCFNVKIIYHLYGRGLQSSYNLNKFKIALYKWMFNKSTVIIQSPLLYDQEMEAFISPKQVYSVSNGIKSTKYTHFAYNESNETPVILFVSTIAKMKGPLVLLEALDMINKKNINFKAIFIGAPLDITSEEFNEQIKKYNLNDKIKYLGTVPHEIKSKYLASSDMFILPTLNDAFPLTILEAMEAGLPVISTIEGAIPEIIDEGVSGYLVPKNDIKKLADKIEILIKNPQIRISMGNIGRKKFLETYTLDIFENNIKKAFDNVCHDNKK